MISVDDFEAFQDLLDLCRIGAMLNAMRPSEESIYRSICRDYSHQFNTPLHEVINLDPEFVILNIFELQLEARAKIEDYEIEQDIPYFMETISRIEDPEYDRHEQDQLDDFMAQALQEEKDRLAAGKPVHKSLAKEMEGMLPSGEPDKPKEGFVNLSYMDDESNR